MTSPVQTVTGKGTSNPFIAGGLLKILGGLKLLKVALARPNNPMPSTAKDREEFLAFKTKRSSRQPIMLRVKA